MLNLNGRSEHFCRMWVKLLMDEALRVIWPPGWIRVKLLMNEALQVIWPKGKSHAEPQRLLWSGGFALKMLEHFCRILSEISDG